MRAARSGIPGVQPAFVALCIWMLLAPAIACGLGTPTGRNAPDAGQRIYFQHCAVCHGVWGEGRSGIISIAGPNIQAEHNTGQALTAIYTGPSHMPVFSYILSNSQANAVARYVTGHLATIPLTGANLSEGGKLFGLYCATCHRSAVRGGALAFTGVNAPALTYKSDALIAGAIRWGPGPMPRFPQSVLKDQQVASLVNYVRFVQHPPDPGGNPLQYLGPTVEGLVACLVVLLLIAMAGLIEKGGKG